MSTESSMEFRKIIVNLNNNLYSISAEFIKSMEVITTVTKVPNSPDYLRGMVDVKGEVIPLIDMRMRLGYTSSNEEVENLVKLLDQREQDHKNWLNELEASVNENREFKLTTDPHKCAFGKWYDHFTTENIILSRLLQEFDAPHKRIHAIGIDVRQHVQNGELDKAKKIILECRDTELAKMINLFDRVKKVISEKSSETMIVLDANSKSFAITVDSVVAVDKTNSFEVDDFTDMNVMKGDHQFVSSLSQFKRDDKDYILLDLDVEKIYNA